MPKQRSQTTSNKRSHISPVKAHERAVQAWITKHARYRYGKHNMHRMSYEDVDALNEDANGGFHEFTQDAAVDQEDMAQERALKQLQDSKLGDSVQTKRLGRRKAQTEAWKQQNQPSDKSTTSPMGPAGHGHYPPEAPTWTHAPGKAPPPVEVRGSGQSVIEHIDRINRYLETSEDSSSLEELVNNYGFEYPVDGKTHTFVPSGEGDFFSLENPNYRLRRPSRYKYIDTDPSTGLPYKDGQHKIAIFDNPKIQPDAKFPRNYHEASEAEKAEMVALYKARMGAYKEKRGDKFDRTVAAHEKAREDKGHWKAQHEQLWGYTDAFGEKQAGQYQIGKNRYKKGQANREYQLFDNGGAYKPKAGGNDFGISQAEERVLKSHTWELVDDKHKNRESKDKLVFTLPENPKQPVFEDKETDWSTGIVTTSGKNIEDALSEIGIRGALQQKDDGTYVLTTAEGNRINPAHAEMARQKLDELYGVDSFQREGPAMRMKTQVVSKDKYIPDDDWAYDYERTTQGRKLGERELKRNAKGEITGLGDLKEGESDRIAFGVRLPGSTKEQKVYWNIQERTDTEAKLNHALTVGAKNEYLSNAHEAYLAAEAGDDSMLREMVLAQHPDIVTPDGVVNESELEERKNHLKELGGAGISVAAYKARKGAKNTFPKKVAHKSERVGKFVDENHIPFLGSDPDYELITKPIGQKLDEYIWRLGHPFDSTRNPGANRLEVAFPHIKNRYRYREYFTKNSRQHVRELKQSDALYDLARSRHRLAKGLNEIEEGMDDAPRSARLRGRITLNSSRGTIEKSQVVNFDESYPKLLNRYENDPEFKERLGYNPGEYAQGVPVSAGVTNELGGQRERLTARYSGSSEYSPGFKHLKMAGKGGAGLLAAGAVVGAGVYGYDRYREGHPVENDKRLRDHLPESISYPTAEVKVTRRATIPTNAFTDALDVGGEKVPVRWKVSPKQKTVVQLRNRRDVSGELYHTNGQIAGGVKVNANTIPGVENDGSWMNSLMYNNDEKGRYRTQPGAVVVGGKELPFHFEQTGKNRYKKGDLSTSNPSKLNQEAREKIALTIIKGGPMSKEFEYQYGDDPKIAEILKDEREKEKLRRKYDYLYVPGDRGTGVKQGTKIQWQEIDPPRYVDEESDSFVGGTKHTMSEGSKRIPLTVTQPGARQLPDGRWVAPVYDHEGNAVTRSAHNQTDRPYMTGRFDMNESEAKHHISEAEQAHWDSQQRYRDTFGKTLETIDGHTYATNAEKRGRPGDKSDTVANDDRGKQVSERRQKSQDKKDQKRTGIFDD